MIVSLVTMLAWSCGTAPAPWSYERNLGVVAPKGGKGCFQIQNPAVPPNTAIRVITTVLPQSVADAHVGPAGAECSGYGVSPVAGQMPAIGILNYAGAFRKDGGLVSADLDGDGAPEYFRSCLSQEGIHFTVWTGKPLSGKLRWHQYHYLGYDVSPDCKPEEAGK